MPLKKPKGTEQNDPNKSYSRLISRFRQPIESFFKWLNDKTQMQTASSVRSANGLLLHCFGKLSFALLLLVFYYDSHHLSVLWSHKDLELKNWSSIKGLVYLMREVDSASVDNGEHKKAGEIFDNLM